MASVSEELAFAGVLVAMRGEAHVVSSELHSPATVSLDDDDTRSVDIRRSRATRAAAEEGSSVRVLG